MVTFTTEKKRQQIYIIVFILVIIAIGLVLWQGYFKEKKPTVTPTVSVSPLTEIKINFDVLKRLADFSPFSKISEWSEAVGRENPFIAY